MPLVAGSIPASRSIFIDRQALADRWGPDIVLEEIRRRLTCQECGRRPERLSVGFEQAAVRPESLGSVNKELTNIKLERSGG